MRQCFVARVTLHPSDGVSAECRMMYWTDWGSEAKIERSYMSGRGRQTVVTTGLVWPNGIFLDFGSNRIYWVDVLGKVYHLYTV